MRSCRKSTGLPSCSRITRAITRYKGARRVSAKHATERSTNLLPDMRFSLRQYVTQDYNYSIYFRGYHTTVDQQTCHKNCHVETIDWWLSFGRSKIAKCRLPRTAPASGSTRMLVLSGRQGRGFGH